MRTSSRKAYGWGAAAALAVVLGAPTLAQAQQGGLFPLAPIRRQRTPCPAEDPVYRLYRQEYFGYHPTCWRKFPTGWGCPSPEAPNAAEEFRKLPRDTPPDDRGDAGTEPEGDNMGPGNRRNDRDDAQPPIPSDERSPFELDKPKGNAPAGDTDLPPVNPTDMPADGAKPGAAALAPITQPGEQPLLALPDPSVPTETPPAPGVGMPTPNGGFRDVEPSAAAPSSVPPTQVARRSGVMSNLFSGRLFRRR